MALRGDWAKPLLLWAGKTRCGLTHRQIGELAGGMDYAAVTMMISRFAVKARKNRKLRQLMQALKDAL